MAYEGEIAALATAFCWANTSMFFAAAGKRIGSFQVNQIRIVMAVVFLILMHVVVYRTTWPAIHAENLRSLLMLGASGLVGLFLGDTFYFKALVDLGPKLATVLMSIHPLIAAFIAWMALGESLGALALVGMGIAIAGVAIAVMGKRSKEKDQRIKHVAIGVLFGFIGAVGQGAGIVLAKSGLNDPKAAAGGIDKFNALSGTLIRMTVAMVALWVIATGQFIRSRRSGRPMALAASFRNAKALGFTAGGAFFGPFLGVWLSLFAVMHGKVGIVTTIMATIPVIAIPLTWAIHRERPTMLEIVGALVTVAGVGVLVLSTAG
jgi:drug/metabolite transporter (DMT)-like permease